VTTHMVPLSAGAVDRAAVEVKVWWRGRWVELLRLELLHHPLMIESRK